MEKPVIPVILLTYKHTNLIEPLLLSIQEDHLDLKIIILDNGSTEISWQQLNQIRDQRITLIRSKLNLGYTGGINLAVNFAMTLPITFEYFFIINPDTKCTPNIIYGLYCLLSKDPKFACISPQIVSPDGHVTYSGGKIDLKKGLVYHEVFTNSAYYDPYFEVDSYTGCAVLFNLNEFKKSGMLNEDLFIYFDEADSSLKIQRNGSKILYAPNLQVFHDTSFTMRQVSHLKTYYMARNKFIVFNKTMNLPSKLFYVLHEMLYHLKNRRIRNTRYLFLGITHFYLGKKGQISTH